MGKFLFRKISILVTMLLVFQMVFPVVNILASSTGNDVLPPSNLDCQLLTPDDVKLTWSPVTSSVSYNVYGITDGQLMLLGNTTSTSYTIKDLPEGSYRYVVTTLSTYGESGPCAPVTVNIVYPDMLAPATFNYAFKNGNDIVLSWGASQYAETYNLYKIEADGQKTLLVSLTGRTHTVTDLAEGTFTYAVSSENSLYGESPLSNPLQVEVVHTVMAAPGNFTFTVANGNDINLKWSTVSYASGYNVYQVIEGQKILKSTVTGTTVTYSNMPAGDYIYEVYSCSDRFGESPEGSLISFTLETVIMAAPSNFTYKINNGNNIVLTWGAVSNATSYKVYQVIDGQKVLKSTVTGTTVTYSNMPAGDYIYEVYSCSDRFGESPEGSLISFTLETVIMAAPQNFTYKINNGNNIVLTWGAVSNATSYKVYQVIDGQKVLKSTVTGTTVTYNNMPEGDYNYEVYSFSTRFGESQDGSLLSFSLVFPIMQPPANLFQTIKSATSFALNWDASDYATNYKVYQIVNGQKVLKSTVTGTTVTYTNMQPGEYTYEIYSYSTRFGESLEGSPLVVTLNGQTMETPANLTFSILSGNDINLKWNSVPYVTNYRVYQVVEGQKILKSTTTSTSIKYTNMPEGDYQYVVHSFSTLLGESPEGAEISFSLVHPVMAAPGNLAYRIQNGNDVVLTWETVAYANKYKVYELIDGQIVLITTVSTLAATISKVPDGDHTYVVNSLSDRFGESSEGSQVSLTLYEHVMQAPGNLTKTITAGNDITLKWDAVTYATSYKIYQIIDEQKILKNTVTGASTKYTNMPEGDYIFEVHSCSDRFGESPEGSTVSFNLIFPTMQAPGNLTQVISNGNDITLKWDAATYATSYKIYQITDGQKVLKNTVTGTSTKYTNMPEGDYTYEVQSHSDRFGESPESSTLDFTLVWPVVEPPILKWDIYNINNITLSWQTVTWANEYRVYEVTDSGRQLLYNGTAKSYKLNNLSEATHSYEITAYSTRFGESAPSNRLTENIIYPEMEPPAASLQLLDTTSALISWEFVTYANGYNVYEVTGDKPVLVAKNVNNLFYIINDLPYRDHEYYVTSYSNSFGESEPSNTVIAKLIVDTEAPVTTSDAPTGWSNQTAVVNLTATDNETGVASTYYSLNGSGYTEGTTFTVDTEGVNSISFYSVDKVGNIEQTQTIEVKIDRTAPHTTADIPASWSREDVVVNLAGSDALSGIAKTFYSINGSAYMQGSSFAVNEEGVNQVSFYSVDNAGNVETANTVEVKVDKTAPVVTMDLNGEYALGAELQLTYSSSDSLSGIASEMMTVYSPGEAGGIQYENGTAIVIDKPGVYNITITVTDAAGWSTTLQEQFTAYIQGTIEVTPKVMQANSGVFTVRVNLPAGFSTKDFDLDTASLNGVSALTSNKGYYNQAKIGQFKFERSDFTWTPSEVTVRFSCYANGVQVVGQTTVKVQK